MRVIKNKPLKTMKLMKSKLGCNLTHMPTELFMSVIILITGLVISFMISSCNGVGLGRNRYYQGTEALHLQFGDMPNVYYFYGDEDLGTELQIPIYLENRGASHAAGAVYLYGYNPDIMVVQGMEALSSSIGVDCDINIDLFGQHPLLSIDCAGGNAGGGVDFNSLLNSINVWLNLGDLSFNWDPNQGTLDIGTMWGDISLEYLHGKVLVPMLLPMPWSIYYGRIFAIPGNTPETPGGGSDQIIYDATIVNFPKGTDTVSFDLKARACYGYVTDTAVDVCVNPYYFEPGEAACRPKEVITPKGSGAPVGVSKIEQHTSHDKITFVITIKNFRMARGKHSGQSTSSGRVWNIMDIFKCSPYYPRRITQQDRDKVLLAFARMAGDPQPLDCKPSRWVYLDPRTGEGKISCTYDIKTISRAGYPDTLVLEIWYGYQQDITKRIKLKMI